MPFLRVISNASLKSNNLEEFAEKAAELISETTGKPINYIGVYVKANEVMCFNGSAKTKGVLAYLESIGFRDKNKVAKVLTDFFCDKFEGVNPSTVNIVLQDVTANDVANSGHMLG